MESKNEKRGIVMKQFCDLHAHSIFSDGTLTPTQLVELAEQIGLGAVALTDHNTVLGLPEFLAAARGKAVHAVPGVEFSTDYQGQELHILALYIQPKDYDAAMSIARWFNENKKQSNLDLIANLNKAGYAISYEKIKASMPAGEPNRALIAAELTKCGYTASNQEAFERLLSPKHGYYHPPKRIDTFELIDFVHSTGAVPVWAHPFLHLKEQAQVRSFLPRAIEAGLKGMEVRYPLFSREQTELALALTEEYGLLPSGGSDFHGENKPAISLGTGMGGLDVPLSWCEALEQAAR
jgi:predicted metal-dependent phosphoesterase TrpH